MADHLDLVAEYLPWTIESVELGIHCYRGREIKHIVEAVACVHDLCRRVWVPHPFYFGGIHTVGEIDRWCDIKILEGCECGRYGDAVTHAVAPVLDQTLFKEHILLGCERVVELTGIAHLYFLIPALLAHAVLRLKGKNWE